jgi:hypothetical protein
MSTGGPVADSQQRPVALLKHHLPLLLTGVGFTLLYFRVLVIAHYHPVTFRAILANSSPTQVILGTLVSSLQYLLILTAAVSIPVLYREKSRNKKDLEARLDLLYIGKVSKRTKLS